MNMAGIHFNNSNWPHILGAIRLWCVAILGVWPALYWILRQLIEKVLPDPAGVIVQLLVFWTAILGGLLVPVYVVGRKYE